jgi:hypothetical protein
MDASPAKWKRQRSNDRKIAKGARRPATKWTGMDFTPDPAKHAQNPGKLRLSDPTAILKPPNVCRKG